MPPPDVIHVRRLKDLDDKTSVLGESEEYFNSDDVFDVSRMNIAKPGELYRVVLPRGGIHSLIIWTRDDIADLYHWQRHSDCIYVIEQEDWGRKLNDGQLERLEWDKAQMSNLEWRIRSSWWLRKLNAILHINDSVFDVPEEYHGSFVDDESVPAYAYQSKPKASRSAVQYDTRAPHPRILDDPPHDDSESIVVTTAVNSTPANRRVTQRRDSS